MVRPTTVGPSLLRAVLLGVAAFATLGPAVAMAHVSIVSPIVEVSPDSPSVGLERLLPVDFDVPNDAAITGDVPDRVIQTYEKIVSPDRGASIFFDRGVAGDRVGRYDRALLAYGQAIKRDPRNASAFNNRCFDEAILGKLDSAIADCSESLRLRPSNASALDSLGLAYLKLNHLKAAIADYDAALKIEPELAMSLFGRGVAKRRKGDTASGNADIAAAKAIKADIADDMAKMGVHL